MKTLKVYELLRKRALVTRGSARAIRDALVDAITADDAGIALDFSGVDAVTPSFVDETLAVVDEALHLVRPGPFRILFLNPPMRLSAKFVAVAKGRDLQISELDGKAWVITGDR